MITAAEANRRVEHELRRMEADSGKPLGWLVILNISKILRRSNHGFIPAVLLSLIEPCFLALLAPGFMPPASARVAIKLSSPFVWNELRMPILTNRPQTLGS